MGNLEQALIQLNFRFPGITEAPKITWNKVLSQIKPTLALSVGAIAFGLLRGSSRLSSLNFAMSAILAGGTSYGVRQLLHTDGPARKLGHMEFTKEVARSKPFLAGKLLY